MDGASYIVGITVTRGYSKETPDNTIYRKIYVNGILQKLEMQDCNPVHTPRYNLELSNEFHVMHGRKTRHVDDCNWEFGFYEGRCPL